MNYNTCCKELLYDLYDVKSIKEFEQIVANVLFEMDIFYTNLDEKQAWEMSVLKDVLRQILHDENFSYKNKIKMPHGNSTIALFAIIGNENTSEMCHDYPLDVFIHNAMLGFKDILEFHHYIFWTNYYILLAMEHKKKDLLAYAKKYPAIIDMMDDGYMPYCYAQKDGEFHIDVFNKIERCFFSLCYKKKSDDFIMHYLFFIITHLPKYCQHDELHDRYNDLLFYLNGLDFIAKYKILPAVEIRKAR